MNTTIVAKSYIYKDRIEISSPGGLASGISENQYLNGNISILRNPIIAAIPNIMDTVHLRTGFRIC